MRPTHSPRVLACAALLLAGCVPSLDPAGRTAAAPFRVVTWNVHDLFDEHDRTSSPGELDRVLTPSEVEGKLAAVGAVLARLDADAVVLQEVENLAILERLARGPLDGLGYGAWLVEGFDPRGIDVALLSRIPVLAWVSHLDERSAAGAPLFSRDLAEIHLDAGGRRAVLLAAHLISQAGDNDARRREQASAARAHADRLAAEWPDALVLVLGDLNDEPGAAPLAPLLGDGTWADVAAALPLASAWTWRGGALESRLDYVLPHRRTLARLRSVEVIGGSDVAAASDHRPVQSDFEPW